MNQHDALMALGINVFAVQLLAESLLRHAAVAQHSTGEPLEFEWPVHRGDCPGWAGVHITLKAIPAPADEGAKA